MNESGNIQAVTRWYMSVLHGWFMNRVNDNTYVSVPWPDTSKTIAWVSTDGEPRLDSTNQFFKEPK